jgi:hypothetical protein
VTPGGTAAEAQLDARVVDLNRRLLSAEGTHDATLPARLVEAREDLDRFRSELYVRHPRVEVRRTPEVEPLAAVEKALRREPSRSSSPSSIGKHSFSS